CEKSILFLSSPIMESSSTDVIPKKSSKKSVPKKSVLKKSVPKKTIPKKTIPMKRTTSHSPKSSHTTMESISTYEIDETNNPPKRRKKKNSRPRIKKWKSSKRHPILSFPPELFINIFYFCDPQTLLSLSKVCRQFAMYLNSPDSSITTKIWKDSRKGFLSDLKLDPPEGMTEKEYCKLFVERGCMICGQPRVRKVYWAFRVRCCVNCLDKITISDYRIDSEMGVPSCVLLGLPYVPQQKWAKRRGSFIVKAYSVKQIKKAYKEYKKLPAKERKDWCQRMKIRGIGIMKEVTQ
ncbi:15375_t:CDS:2, partial [Dentiscutata heterogama]